MFTKSTKTNITNRIKQGTLKAMKLVVGGMTTVLTTVSYLLLDGNPNFLNLQLFVIIAVFVFLGIVMTYDQFTKYWKTIEERLPEVDRKPRFKFILQCIGEDFGTLKSSTKQSMKKLFYDISALPKRFSLITIKNIITTFYERKK